MVVARATEMILSWIMWPPLVTSLQASGEAIDIRGVLYGPSEWMGRWDAGNLPIFIIASLGLAVSVPVRDAAERASLVGGTVLVCFVVMVALSVVEVLTVSASWAAAREKVVLVTASERELLESAHGSVDLIQMLLPALLAIVSYGLYWAGGATTAPAGSWKVAGGLWLAVVAVVLTTMLLPPRVGSRADRLARLAKTAELNPKSAKVWLAYAQAAIRTGSREALAAFERAGTNGADGHAVRIGLAQARLAGGQPAEALATAERALASGPASPALLLVEARALMRLGRPCEADARLETAIASRKGKIPPGLRSASENAARACRDRT